QDKTLTRSSGDRDGTGDLGKANADNDNGSSKEEEEEEMKESESVSMAEYEGKVDYFGVHSVQRISNKRGVSGDDGDLGEGAAQGRQTEGKLTVRTQPYSRPRKQKEIFHVIVEPLASYFHRRRGTRRQSRGSNENGENTKEQP